MRATVHIRFRTVYLFLFFLLLRASRARSVRHTAVPEGSTIALPCGWAGDAADDAAAVNAAEDDELGLSWRFGRHSSQEIFVGFSAVVGGRWDSTKFDLIAKVCRYEFQSVARLRPIICRLTDAGD